MFSMFSVEPFLHFDINVAFTMQATIIQDFKDIFEHPYRQSISLEEIASFISSREGYLISKIESFSYIQALCSTSKL